MQPFQTFVATAANRDAITRQREKLKAEELEKRMKEATEWDLKYAAQDAPFLGNATREFIDGTSKLYRAGKPLNIGSPEYTELLKAKANRSELGRKSTDQEKYYTEVMKQPETAFGKYTDGKAFKADNHIWFVGEDGKRYVDSRNDADRPNISDPKYFRYSAFLDDKVKNIQADETIQTQIKNGALGQLYVDTSTSFRFTTKNKNGQVVPGIGQEHINYFLSDPEYKENVGYRANQQLRQEAMQAKQTNPAFANMTEQQVMDELAVRGDDINERINALVKKDLEVYQEKKYSQKIRSGQTYRAPSGDDESTSATKKKDVAADERLRFTNLLLAGDKNALNAWPSATWDGGKVIEAKPTTTVIKGSGPTAAGQYRSETKDVIELTVDYGDQTVPIDPQDPYKGTRKVRNVKKIVLDRNDPTIRAKMSSSLNTSNSNVEPEYFQRALEREAAKNGTPKPQAKEGKYDNRYNR